MNADSGYLECGPGTKALQSRCTRALCGEKDMLHAQDTRLWGCLAVPLLLACCHDAARDNPLDPSLTPPVELAVALNDTAGTATLT